MVLLKMFLAYTVAANGGKNESIMIMYKNSEKLALKEFKSLFWTDFL